MDDLMKKNLAEETIRQKEVARQMSQQMLKQKQQEAGQVDVSGSRDRDSAKDRSRKLDELLSGKDSSKSEFDKYLEKVDVVIKTGISDLLVGRGRMATDSMLDSMNLEDALPVFAENPEILDASHDMAMSLTDQDPKISSFYDKIKDKVNQYKAEKAITESDVDDTDDKNIFGDMGDDSSNTDHGFLDEDETYDVQSFINFKDAFVQHFKSHKDSSDDDLSKDLDSQMASFLGGYAEENPPMVGAGAPDDSSGSNHDYTSYKGINDNLYEDDTSFQEDQSTQLNFLRQLCPKGMMGAIMLAFFVAQQAMQENMKGPATDVYSTSGSVTRLSQFASAMKKMPNTDDAGSPIVVYKTKWDGKQYIFDPLGDDKMPVVEPNPTMQQYMQNLLCAGRGQSYGPDGAKKMIPTASKSAAGIVTFIRDSAKIFGANLDEMLPTSLEIGKVTEPMVAGIVDAYNSLMGTSTNKDSTRKVNDDPADGIIAKWFLKNDPHNASQILQTLNGGGYAIYKDGDDGYNKYGSIKDGLSANLSTSTAALNLGQSQQNANNTAFYGWMKSWEDNAIEIARKTG
jgi:hypothetical protein